MNNLVIIGNGFDLAHGLKTSYVDFIKHVIDSKSINKGLFSNLLGYGNRQYNYEDLTNVLRSDLPHPLGVIWENKFFKAMIMNASHYNWCDVEKLYYDELLGSYYKSPKLLNEEFEAIKIHLENYLEVEKAKFHLKPSYTRLFSHLKNAQKSFILNFNYTNTVTKYCENSDLRVINIHGELKNENNPIIFGFAADDHQSRTLIDKGDKEYMRNIKKHCYKRTKSQNKLIDYLETTEKIDVLVFGHSCGISDKLILNQILNHKNISSIRVFYHEIHETYFETQVNIDRIMNNDANFSKLLNFEESYRMPQHTDSEEAITKFENYVISLLNSQKAKAPFVMDFI